MRLKINASGDFASELSLSREKKKKQKEFVWKPSKHLEHDIVATTEWLPFRIGRYNEDQNATLEFMHTKHMCEACICDESVMEGCARRRRSSATIFIFVFFFMVFLGHTVFPLNCSEWNDVRANNVRENYFGRFDANVIMLFVFAHLIGLCTLAGHVFNQWQAHILSFRFLHVFFLCFLFLFFSRFYFCFWLAFIGRHKWIGYFIIHS